MITRVPSARAHGGRLSGLTKKRHLRRRRSPEKHSRSPSAKAALSIWLRRGIAAAAAAQRGVKRRENGKRGTRRRRRSGRAKRSEEGRERETTAAVQCEPTSQTHLDGRKANVPLVFCHILCTTWSSCAYKNSTRTDCYALLCIQF